ncbi:hypothetical protein FC40_GL000334 [Ligilactobacillus hayakitensis DSM 18933 = JCM 14209]|uniref:Uncharacterized protein n=1 Tax=Ligilactobacillus hayakitensis DSM 18933 = JCM 14209 TaxID=1423755 RepID=A0A0R1WQI6_9LACO|nr:hypothetical protein [Ligilactobacillus hayakitensis]KRM20170.1 hypothetical protein FC40_GL000334 [Ligilactobacillus hayakitensis DSM 18933 = JCM 14209]
MENYDQKYLPYLIEASKANFLVIGQGKSTYRNFNQWESELKATKAVTTARLFKLVVEQTNEFDIEIVMMSMLQTIERNYGKQAALEFADEFERYVRGL